MNVWNHQVASLNIQSRSDIKRAPFCAIIFTLFPRQSVWPNLESAYVLQIDLLTPESRSVVVLPRGDRGLNQLIRFQTYRDKSILRGSTLSNYSVCSDLLEPQASKMSVVIESGSCVHHVDATTRANPRPKNLDIPRTCDTNGGSNNSSSL